MKTAHRKLTAIALAAATFAAGIATAQAQYYGRGGYYGGYRAPVCQDVARRVFVYGYGFVVKTTRYCQ